MQPAYRVRPAQAGVVEQTIGNPEFCETVKQVVIDAWDRTTEPQQPIHLKGWIGGTMYYYLVQNLEGALAGYGFIHSDHQGQLRASAYERYAVPVHIVPGSGRIAPDGSAIYTWPRGLVTRRMIAVNRRAISSLQDPLPWTEEDLRRPDFIEHPDALTFSLLHRVEGDDLVAWLGLGVEFKSTTMVKCSDHIEVCRHNLSVDQIGRLALASEEADYPIRFGEK